MKSHPQFIKRQLPVLPHLLDLLNHVAKFVRLREIGERVQSLEAKLKS